MVHLTIEFMGYSEEDKNRRVGVLNDIHYKHFELLLEIADKELIAAEQRITSKIYNLEKTQEFNKLLSRDKIVNKIYSDMTKLFNLYKTLKNPMFVERDLLENIRKLDEDEEFTNACKAYPELMEIKSNLSLLYSAYEYKQTIYDELAFIEKEYGVNDPIIR
jgi:superfamily I DNA/RNA helicase